MTTASKPFLSEDLRDTILAIRRGVNYHVVSSKYNLSLCCIKITMLEVEKYKQDEGQELIDDENRKKITQWIIQQIKASISGKAYTYWELCECTCRVLSGKAKHFSKIVKELSVFVIAH